MQCKANCHRRPAFRTCATPGGRQLFAPPVTAACRASCWESACWPPPPPHTRTTLAPPAPTHHPPPPPADFTLAQLQAGLAAAGRPDAYLSNHTPDLFLEMIDLGGVTQEQIVLEQQAEAPTPAGTPLGTVANVRRRLAQAAGAAPAPAGDALGAPAPGPDGAPAGGAGYCANKPVPSRIIGFIFDSVSRYKLKPVLKDASSIPKSVSHLPCVWECVLSRLSRRGRCNNDRALLSWGLCWAGAACRELVVLGAQGGLPFGPGSRLSGHHRSQQASLYRRYPRGSEHVPRLSQALPAAWLSLWPALLANASAASLQPPACS